MVDGLDDHTRLRTDLAELYRTLRDADAGGLEAAARDRSPRRNGRLLRVLADLGLADVDVASRAVRVRDQPADLASSPAFGALLAGAQERRSWLTRSIVRAA